MGQLSWANLLSKMDYVGGAGLLELVWLTELGLVTWVELITWVGLVGWVIALGWCGQG